MRVLFLCVHNSSRSQLAEGILRSLAPAHWEIYSAGSEPSTVNPLALRTLQAQGLDTRSHRSKSVSEFLGQSFDYVITLCAEEVCPLFPGPVQRLHWPLPDPSAVTGEEAARLAAFEQTAVEIERRLREWLRLISG